MLSSRRVATSIAGANRSGSSLTSTPASIGPILVGPAETAVKPRLREGFGARDHFQDLLGDLGLAGAVHLEGQRVDQLAGVLGRVPHRGHPRALLRRGGIEERPVDL